jgi:hypothetical protein
LRSDGILLLESERILHHFPYQSTSHAIHDLESTATLLVAGARLEGRATVGLDVYDLETGRALERVTSANPHLRFHGEGEDLWRVLISGDEVGVYHPPTAASYPLWERPRGILPSPDQMSRAQGGLGFGREITWVPHQDGSISRKERGRTARVTDSFGGDFVDVVSDTTILLLQPAETVRSDANGEVLLSSDLAVRLVEASGTHRDFRLRSLSPDVTATRLVIHGRSVRVRNGRLYWIYLGYDYLEIRTASVPALRAGS